MFAVIQQDKKSNSFKSWFLLFCTFLLLTCAIYGTNLSAWWDQGIWASNANRNSFTIFTAVSYTIYFLSLRLGLPFWTLLLPPALLYVHITGLAPIASVVWFWVCSVIMGATFVGFISGNYLKIWSLRNAAIGFAFAGTFISILAHFPINYPSIYFIFFSLIGTAGAWYLSRCGQSILPDRLSFFLLRRSVLEDIVAAIVLLGINLVVAVTILPDVGYDALAVHLNIPSKMLEVGMWSFDVKKYIWSVMPLGADWLYVPPYFLAGEQGARLLNSSFLLAIAFASYSMLNARIGVLLALVAPALLLTLPLSLLEVGSTFVEAPLAFFFIMSLIEIDNRDGERTGRWLVLGVLAGYACSIKLLGVLILPFLLIGALLRSRSDRFERVTPRAIGAGFLVFLIFSLSPYITALFKTGNPLFPFFNSIFQSPDFIVGSFFGNGDDFSNPFYKKEIGLKTFWDMSINSKSFGEFNADGALGIGFLVLVPLSLLASSIERRWFILTCICSVLLYVILVFNNQAYLRYVYPVFPWMIVIGTWALSQLPYPSLNGTIILLVLSFVNISRFPVAHWPFQQFNFNLIWSASENIAFFSRSKPEAIIGQILSKRDAFKGKKILILGLNPVYSSFPDGTLADSWHSWPYYAPSLKDSTRRTSLARSGAEVIVHSVGRGYPGEAELLDITTEQFRLGDLRVGLVNSDSLFIKERLNGADLRLNGGAEWQLNGAIVNKAGASLSGSTEISQKVVFTTIDLTTLEPDLANILKKILPTKINVDPVQLEMLVTCNPGQSFRSRVSWLDSNDKVTSSDIATHPCNSDVTHMKRILLKPGSAKIGVVYGGSNDHRAVVIEKISLRSPE